MTTGKPTVTTKGNSTIGDILIVQHALKVCLVDAKTDARVSTLTKAYEAIVRLGEEICPQQ